MMGWTERTGERPLGGLGERSCVGYAGNTVDTGMENGWLIGSSWAFRARCSLCFCMGYDPHSLA
jgi:hypothetical protein